MAHEELPSINITPGAIRFNTDSMKLEYFRISTEGGSTSSYAGIGTLAAGEWVQITTDSPDIQTGGTRGVYGGLSGNSPTPAYNTVIEYIDISSTGNAQDFGDLTVARGNGVAACSSSTRGLFQSGYVAPTSSNIIDYITISSTGNAIDFGDNILRSEGRRAFSNQTRGISFGGQSRGSTPLYQNLMDYVTIASTGDAQDFGDLSPDADVTNYGAVCSSSTRGILASSGDAPNAQNIIEFTTISTQGNTADFGDLTASSAYGTAGASNSVRGVFCGGGSPRTNIIDYITIATLGNAQDFGDFTGSGISYYMGGASSTRGIFARHQSPSGATVINYVEIMSPGDSIDFGDASAVRGADGQILSNGHGGLG